jgi:hypothetical protein
MNTLLTDLGTLQPAAEPTAAAQAQQLCLWLLASMTGLPDTALAGLGLDTGALERLRAQYAADLQPLRQLAGMARLLTRQRTAELLRVRVNGMALTARTPAEMAAVARAVKTLPEWVWDDALVQDAAGADAAQPAGEPSPAGSSAGQPRSVTQQMQELDQLLRMMEAQGVGQPGDAVASPSSPLPLNRQQRRMAESLARKRH